MALRTMIGVFALLCLANPLLAGTTGGRAPAPASTTRAVAPATRAATIVAQYLTNFQNDMHTAAGLTDSAERLTAKRFALTRLLRAEAQISTVEKQLLDELAGPDGGELAVEIGRALALAGADEAARLREFGAQGKAAAERVNDALAQFDRVYPKPLSNAVFATPEAQALVRTFGRPGAVSAEARLALAHGDPQMRLAGLVACAQRPLRADDWQSVLALLKDPDIHVRHQAAIVAALDKEHPHPDFDEQTILFLRDVAGCQTLANQWIDAHGIKEDASINKLLLELTLEGRRPNGDPPYDPIVLRNLPPALVGAIATRPIALLPPTGGWTMEPAALYIEGSPLPISPNLIARQEDDLRVLTHLTVVSEKVLRTLIMLPPPPSTNISPQINWDQCVPPIVAAMLKIDSEKTIDTLGRIQATSADTLRSNKNIATLLRSLDQNLPSLALVRIRFASLAIPGGTGESEEAAAYFRQRLPKLDDAGALLCWELLHSSNASSAEALWQLTLPTRWTRSADVSLTLWRVILQRGTSSERLRLLAAIEIDGELGASGALPGYEEAFADPNPEVRKKIISCIAPRGRGLPSDTLNTSKLLVRGLRDSDQEVRLQSFRVAGSQGGPWLGNPDILSEMIDMLGSREPARIQTWKILQAGAVDGRLRGHPQFQQVLTAAVWDESLDIQRSARQLWSGPLPPAPTPPVVWMMVGLLGLFCLALLSGGGVGMLRARKLPIRPERINGALGVACIAGIVTGIFLMLTTVIVGIVVGLAASAPRTSLEGVPTGLIVLIILAIASFGCGGVLLIPWSIGARRGHLFDAVVVMIIGALSLLAFTCATALDLGDLVLGMTFSSVIASVFFRLMFDLALMISSGVVVLALIRSWTELARRRSVPGNAEIPYRSNVPPPLPRSGNRSS